MEIDSTFKSNKDFKNLFTKKEIVEVKHDDSDS